MHTKYNETQHHNVMDCGVLPFLMDYHTNYENNFK